MRSLIGLIFAISACSHATQSQPAPRLEPRPEPRSETSRAAVEIIADGCPGVNKFGTGMVIKSGRVLTAAHVVAGSTSIEVHIAGAPVAGTLLQYDPVNDLAVIGIDPLLGTPISIAEVAPGPQTVGEVVLFRDHQPQLVTAEIVRPVVIKTKDIYDNTDVSRAGFEIAAEIQVGDSGSVIVVNGRAIGALWARSRTADGRAWAIDLVSNRQSILANIDADVAVDSGQCVD
jgi:S1-C subfamily serine protease